MLLFRELLNTSGSICCLENFTIPQKQANMRSSRSNFRYSLLIKGLTVRYLHIYLATELKLFKDFKECCWVWLTFKMYQYKVCMQFCKVTKLCINYKSDSWFLFDCVKITDWPRFVIECIVNILYSGFIKHYTLFKHKATNILSQPFWLLFCLRTPCLHSMLCFVSNYKNKTNSLSKQKHSFMIPLLKRVMVYSLFRV